MENDSIVLERDKTYWLDDHTFVVANEILDRYEMKNPTNNGVWKCPRCTKMLDTSKGSDEELSTTGDPKSAYCSNCDEVIIPIQEVTNP